MPLPLRKHTSAKIGGKRGGGGRGKKKEKEERNGRLPRLLFFYIDTLYVSENAMQGFVPCHSSFIHKSHSLLNLFLYILHTRSHIQCLDDQTLPILYRCYLNFLAAALAGLPLIAHSIRKSCLPLGVRCTNKPAIAPLELETRSKDRGIGNGIRFYMYTALHTPGHRQLALNQATRDEIPLCRW